MGWAHTGQQAGAKHHCSTTEWPPQKIVLSQQLKLPGSGQAAPSELARLHADLMGTEFSHPGHSNLLVTGTIEVNRAGFGTHFSRGRLYQRILTKGVDIWDR